MTIGKFAISTLTAAILFAGGSSMLSAQNSDADTAPPADAFSPIQRYAIAFDQPRDLAEFYLRDFGLKPYGADIEELPHPANPNMRVLLITLDPIKSGAVRGVPRQRVPGAGDRRCRGCAAAWWRWGSGGGGCVARAPDRPVRLCDGRRRRVRARLARVAERRRRRRLLLLLLLVMLLLVMLEPRTPRRRLAALPARRRLPTKREEREAKTKTT